MTATTISGPLTGNATTATTLQTARTIGGVSFDGSGNISLPGVNTAGNQNTSGNAATATQVNNSLTPGSYLTGSAFNGSAAQTFTVDATTTNTANKIVARDASGHINFNQGFSSYLNMSHGVSGATGDTIFYSSYDNYIRKNNATGFRASLNVPTRTGGDASGTWGINITGNATTATTATNQSGGTVTCTSGTFSGTFSASTASSRDKFRVYPTSQYCIGMQSGVTFGDLNDWSMTFQMNSEDDRGFWWGDDGHSVAQGAMALSTRGWLNVAERIKVGGGQSDTSGPSYPLHVVGEVYATGAFYTDSSRSVIRGGSPTLYFRDTDHNSAMIHNNANLLYILRGGNDTETWTQVNSQWPWIFNLTNNDSTCGGNLYVNGGTVTATTFSGNATTATTATNQSGGTVNASTMTVTGNTNLVLTVIGDWTHVNDGIVSRRFRLT